MGGGVSSRLATGVARLLAVLSCGVGSGACAAAVPSGVAEPEMSFPAPNHPVPRPLGNPAGDERTRDRDGEAALVLDALRIVPGMRVADLQSGDGYYAVVAPGGRLGIVERDRPVEYGGTTPALLRCELEAVGYRQVELIHLTPADGYLAVFEPPREPPEPVAIRACAPDR
jgi:hypothetical protein